jgi:hypothetical protein
MAVKRIYLFLCNTLEQKQHCSAISKNDILLSITNKMQHYTVLFIIINAVHVSGGFSAHHQEFKNCTHTIWYVPAFLLLLLAVAASKLGIYPMLCTVFELLMMGGETA